MNIQKFCSKLMPAGILAVLFLALNCTADTDKADASGKVQPILSADDFNQKVLKSEKPVLVDFFATWCGPCKKLEPVIEKIAGDYEGKADFYRLDVDKLPSIAQEYKVNAIPNVFIFQNGKVAASIVGLREESAYTQALDSAIKDSKSSQTKPAGE